MEKFFWSDPPGQYAFPVARAGYPVVFASAFATLVFALLGFAVLSFLGLLATFCICGFFRDPDRAIPEKEDAVVSPADGKIIYIGKAENNPLHSENGIKISIFMSVFNVHVNRIPYEGQIKKIDYFPGKFFSANLDKASEQNEHNAVCLETRFGDEICFVQIAGLIARRIICYIKPGEQVLKGQRFGIICFGSRLDVYLPDKFQIDVRIGEKVKAGTSILGRFSPHHP
jgi:phosphatidylserine decarboxylase